MEERIKAISTNINVLKILVVDDNLDIRELLTSRLRENKDNIVLEAVDGLDALTVLKKNQDIDMIISDFRMPKMDGVELLNELWKTPKKLPAFILWSGEISKINEHHQDVYSKALAVLTKPGCDEDIYEYIEEFRRNTIGLREKEKIS